MPRNKINIYKQENAIKVLSSLVIPKTAYSISKETSLNYSSVVLCLEKLTQNKLISKLNNKYYLLSEPGWDYLPHASKYQELKHALKQTEYKLKEMVI